MIGFDAARDLALRLPEAEQGTWYGSPAFRVHGRMFVRLDDDDDTLVMRVGHDERDALVGSQPDRFSLTDHPSEHEEFVLTKLSLSSPEDLAELGELFVEAWRRSAPKRLLKEFDVAEVGIESGGQRGGQ